MKRSRTKYTLLVTLHRHRMVKSGTTCCCCEKTERIDVPSVMAVWLWHLTLTQKLSSSDMVFRICLFVSAGGTGSTLKSTLCSLSDISDTEDISNWRTSDRPGGLNTWIHFYHICSWCSIFIYVYIVPHEPYFIQETLAILKHSGLDFVLL